MTLEEDYFAVGQKGEPMDNHTCAGCGYITSFGGNYIECVLLSRFVDWYYWNNKSPDDCPKKKRKLNEQNKV